MQLAAGGGGVLPPGLFPPAALAAAPGPAANGAAASPASAPFLSSGRRGSRPADTPRGPRPRPTTAAAAAAAPSSHYRGVTKHKRSGRFESHIWVRELKRQVYLGGYECEEHAAEAYDIAALKNKGPSGTKTNFELSK